MRKKDGRCLTRWRKASQAAVLLLLGGQCLSYCPKPAVAGPKNEAVERAMVAAGFRKKPAFTKVAGVDFARSRSRSGTSQVAVSLKGVLPRAAINQAVIEAYFDAVDDGNKHDTAVVYAPGLSPYPGVPAGAARVVNVKCSLEK